MSRSYGPTAALRDVSITARPGELLALVGPSGCGKTTLLRLVAGFEPPDAGRVLISGRDVTSLPPYARPVNTVFQHYALFPHLDVAGNVGFGLKMARRPAAEIGERTARALAMVRLEGLGSRRVDQLSGGQRQRVALARAVVLEPEVLLLDEPMSALDRKLREEMQAEVRALHDRLGSTFVVVTHDQEEALVLGDRIAVMREGRIEQAGTPAEVYDRPRTRFVADFLGVENILKATVEEVKDGRAALRLEGGARVSVEGRDGLAPGAEAWIGIRAARIALHGPHENRVPVVVEDTVYRGDHRDVRLRAGEATLTASLPAASPVPPRGGAAVATFPPEAVLHLEDR